MPSYRRRPSITDRPVHSWRSGRSPAPGRGARRARAPRQRHGSAPPSPPGSACWGTGADPGWSCVLFDGSALGSATGAGSAVALVAVGARRAGATTLLGGAQSLGAHAGDDGVAHVMSIPHPPDITAPAPV